MNRMKRVVLLLLVAVGSNAETEPTPTTGPDHCNDLKSIMQLTDLHKLNGDWEMLWSVSNITDGNKLMSEIRSRNIKFNCDNTTMRWEVRECEIIINVTLPSGPGDAIVHIDKFSLVANGTLITDNGTGVFTFHVSCPDCMVVADDSSGSRFLFYFKRDGVDWSDEMLKTFQDDFKKRAECLGYSLEHLHSHGTAAGFHPDKEDLTKYCVED